MSGTNLSFTRRPASAGSVTPSYRRTAAYMADLLAGSGFVLCSYLRDTHLARDRPGNHRKDGRR
ncbi:hypothetical protein GCM10009730_08230 [Streptomyces albidochromogenes]